MAAEFCMFLHLISLIKTQSMLSVEHCGIEYNSHVGEEALHLEKMARKDANMGGATRVVSVDKAEPRK